MPRYGLFGRIAVESGYARVKGFLDAREYLVDVAGTVDAVVFALADIVFAQGDVWL